MSTLVRPSAPPPAAATRWTGALDRSAAVWLAVLALTAVGAYLRYANLGALGFRWDEDLSSLAVKAILEHGIPELPSGMIYLRGGAFLYLMAFSAQVFGFGEFALRLPAALFGIGLIPLAFVFARALFDSRVGLVAAALIAFSIWDVEFARYARFYSAFAFFYVLTVFSIWRYRVHTTSVGGGWLCIALALVTITLHDLGYTLTLAFLAPLVLDPRGALREPRRLVFPFGAAFVVGVFFLAWRWWLDYLRELPMAAAEPSADAIPAASPDGGVLDAILDRVAFAAAAWDRLPGVWLLLAGAVIAAGVLIARRRPLADRLLIAAIAACCCVQLFNVALLALVGLAFCKREGARGWLARDVLCAAGLIGAAFGAWLAIAVGFDLLGLRADGAVPAAKQSIRALLNYPHFFVFWGYPNEWPFVSAVAAVGGLVAFDRAARPAPDRASVFLAFVLITPLVLNGLFDTLYELFRYNVPLNTFFFTFVALGVVHWTSLLPAGRGERPALVAVGTGALAALVLIYDVNPVRGWLAAQRDYRETGALYRLFGMQRYPDFKTSAGYVAANAGPTDTILALDPREHFNYIGRLDYSVMSGAYETSTYVDGDVRRDLYIDTPLITDVAALRAALSEPGKTKWLIASDTMLAESASVDEPIRQFLATQSARVEYVGRDGSHKVYKFD